MHVNYDHGVQQIERFAFADLDGRIPKETEDRAQVSDRTVFFLVKSEADGGYVATADSVGIVTQGDTLDELKAMVLDAVHCHFDEGERPRFAHLHIVQDETLAVV